MCLTCICLENQPAGSDSDSGPADGERQTGSKIGWIDYGRLWMNDIDTCHREKIGIDIDPEPGGRKVVGEV